LKGPRVHGGSVKQGGRLGPMPPRPHLVQRDGARAGRDVAADVVVGIVVQLGVMVELRSGGWVVSWEGWVETAPRSIASNRPKVVPPIVLRWSPWVL
jgi:hypothetical protein